MRLHYLLFAVRNIHISVVLAFLLASNVNSQNIVNCEPSGMIGKFNSVLYGVYDYFVQLVCAVEAYLSDM